MTYGAHAELAARALNELLTTDVLPSEPFIEKVLQSRDATISALRQRLVDLGMPARSRSFVPPPLPTNLSIAGNDNKSAHLLEVVLTSAPVLPDYLKSSPLESLSTRTSDSVAEAWRVAAVESLAASNALGSAANKPWLSEPAAAWHVIRDLAVGTEALLVLDARLNEVGLLNRLDHGQTQGPADLDALRMVTSQISRMASWYATNPSPDAASPRHIYERTVSGMPVVLVAGPEDFAAAQQRLANFLRLQSPHDAAYDGAPHISADSARQIISSQLHLCRTFAGIAAKSANASTVVEFFEKRVELLGALQAETRHLVNAKPFEPEVRRFWQQTEITTAVARLQRQGHSLALHGPALWELATATHNVTNNLGHTLRRELVREASNLRDAHPRHETGPTKVGRSTPLEMRLADLVCIPAPAIPTRSLKAGLQRAALQATLDHTPSQSPLPSPFPAFRHQQTAPSW